MTLPAKNLSRKIPAGGFFPSAKVIYGQDWVWGDQDGKLLIILCGILCFPTSSASNVMSASPLQAVAQNTPTVAPVPVPPILTPPSIQSKCTSDICLSS